MAIILTAFLVLALFRSKFNSAHGNNEHFWYTCDFHMEPDPDDMSDECRDIYSNKAGEIEVYRLYKTEAALFYKFRNKLVECESHAKICTMNDNDSAFEMPLLIGYDIDNRMRMYQESNMNGCYLKSTSNIDFIKCVIEKRKEMIKQLEKICSRI